MGSNQQSSNTQTISNNETRRIKPEDLISATIIGYQRGTDKSHCIISRTWELRDDSTNCISKAGQIYGQLNFI